MKKCVIVLIAICILGMVASSMVLLVGCVSSSSRLGSVGGQGIPQDFVYAGNRYICTGVVVAEQNVGANIPSNVMYIGSTSYGGGDYDVYLIQGIDENHAIALDIGRGGFYSYFKYERVYGQEEPADFVYQGTNYKETGEIIDIQKVGAQTPEEITYLSSVAYHGTTYDVYSIHIQGEDRSQAIALKIAKAGTTVGFYYYYFGYERQQ